MSYTLVIDGNNVASRAYHTPQGELRSRKGEPTGTILATLNSLKGYLEKFQEATRMVVVWDYGKSEERMKLYPGYKMNRDHTRDDRTPEEILKFEEYLWQMNEIHKFLPALGINSLKVKGWEADDLVYATACLLQGKKTIISSDKDMLQLINEEVSVFDLYKDLLVTPSNFEVKTKGISQKCYLGYRSLLGDDSDNIGGVPGIGEVTAKKLMDTYGHIDIMFKDKDKLMLKSRTAAIFKPENLAIIGRNHKLMNLGYVNYDAIQEDILQMITPVHEIRIQDIKDFFMHKEFVSILSNFTSWMTYFRLLGED